MKNRSVGKHVIRAEGDTFFLACHELMNQEEAIEVHTEIEKILLHQHRVFIIVDYRHGAGTTPEARRWIGEWNERHKANGVAIYGNTGATARALIAMIFAVIRFFRKASLPMVWVKNEAEAVAWVTAERNSLASHAA
jgi:hypothetical protein